MLNRNDCLHLINNHPKLQKTFKLSVTSLSAGEMLTVRDKRENFPRSHKQHLLLISNNKRRNYGNFEIKCKFLIIFRIIYFDFLAFEILRRNPVEINAEALQVCDSVPPPCIEKCPFS